MMCLPTLPFGKMYISFGLFHARMDQYTGGSGNSFFTLMTDDKIDIGLGMAVEPAIGRGDVALYKRYEPNHVIKFSEFRIR